MNLVYLLLSFLLCCFFLYFYRLQLKMCLIKGRLFLFSVVESASSRQEALFKKQARRLKSFCHYNETAEQSCQCGRSQHIVVENFVFFFHAYVRERHFQSSWTHKKRRRAEQLREAVGGWVALKRGDGYPSIAFILQIFQHNVKSTWLQRLIEVRTKVGPEPGVVFFPPCQLCPNRYFYRDVTPSEESQSFVTGRHMLPVTCTPPLSSRCFSVKNFIYFLTNWKIGFTQ